MDRLLARTLPYSFDRVANAWEPVPEHQRFAVGSAIREELKHYMV